MDRKAGRVARSQRRRRSSGLRTASSRRAGRKIESLWARARRLHAGRTRFLFDLYHWRSAAVAVVRRNISNRLPIKSTRNSGRLTSWARSCRWQRNARLNCCGRRRLAKHYSSSACSQTRAGRWEGTSRTSTGPGRRSDGASGGGRARGRRRRSRAGSRRRWSWWWKAGRAALCRGLERQQAPGAAWECERQTRREGDRRG